MLALLSCGLAFNAPVVSRPVVSRAASPMMGGAGKILNYDPDGQYDYKRDDTVRQSAQALPLHLGPTPRLRPR